MTLWTKILIFLSPVWAGDEFRKSNLCPRHKGQSRCDCLNVFPFETGKWDLRTCPECKSEWPQLIISGKVKCPDCLEKKVKDYSLRITTQEEHIKKLDKEIVILKASRDDWKEAWYDQRICTGNNYWAGYRDGKQIAINWHNTSATQIKDNEAYAKLHELSAEKIKSLGYY